MEASHSPGHDLMSAPAPPLTSQTGKLRPRDAEDQSRTAGWGWGQGRHPSPGLSSPQRRKPPTPPTSPASPAPMAAEGPGAPLTLRASGWAK